MNESKTSKTLTAPQNDTILSSSDSIVSTGDISTCSVHIRRLARDWSQAELAKRAEISRASISAIESGRLTPSVATALSLARVLACSVEELFGQATSTTSRDSTWAWQPWLEPYRYWEAEVSAKRLLYPVEAVSLNPVPHDGISKNGVCHEAQLPAPEMTLTVATCDPAAGLLAREYGRESGYRMLVFPRGGGAALSLLKQRSVHVAALHRSTAENPNRNAASVRSLLGAHARLLRVARWESGVALPGTSRASSVKSLTRHVKHWAAREPGSAARECLETAYATRHNYPLRR